MKMFFLLNSLLSLPFFKQIARTFNKFCFGFNKILFLRNLKWKTVNLFIHILAPFFADQLFVLTIPGETFFVKSIYFIFGNDRQMLSNLCKKLAKRTY